MTVMMGRTVQSKTHNRLAMLATFRILPFKSRSIVFLALSLLLVENRDNPIPEEEGDDDDAGKVVSVYLAPFTTRFSTLTLSSDDGDNVSVVVVVVVVVIDEAATPSLLLLLLLIPSSSFLSPGVTVSLLVLSDRNNREDEMMLPVMEG